jgi:hypothetical protein
MSAAVYDIYVTYDLSFFTGVFIFRPCLSLAMSLVLVISKMALLKRGTNYGYDNQSQ